MATKSPAVLANSDIKPYASFTLYTCADKSLKTIKDKIAKLESLAQTSVKGKMTVIATSAQWVEKKATAKAFMLRERRSAAWSVSKHVKDTVHHLVVLLHYSDHFGIVVSDSATRTLLANAIESSCLFQKCDEMALENAFVNDAVLRALWLRGAHRKNERKADSKVLFGPRLQSALNPMDDRSFQSSSVRSEALPPPPGGKQRVIGVTPSSSYLWLGPTKDAGELIVHFTNIIDHFKTKGTSSSPGIPFLAKPLTTEPKAGEVREAFDFSFVEPGSPHLNSDQSQLLERWEQELSITTVGNASGSQFMLNILDVNSAGAWSIQVDVNKWTNGFDTTIGACPGTEKWPQVDDFLSMLQKSSMWSVWFESGHAIVEGKLTRADIVIGDFDQARDASFGPYNIEVEKPVLHNAGLPTKSIDFTKIGDPSDLSLCSWWLMKGALDIYAGLKALAHDEFVHMICDDGAGEVADFILFAKHRIFSTSTNPSRLAVIQVHLKAAGKLDPTPTKSGQPRKRSMAPKKFEEVLQQAVKNQAVVRMPELAAALSKALKDGENPLWTLKGNAFTQTLAYGTKLPAGSQVLVDLSHFNNQRYHKHVVVVQPHQSLKEFNDEMAKPHPAARMRLLCTLLNHADAACRTEGAKFECVFSP